MRIEFLENWKHQGVDYEAGDRKTFDDNTGTFFCNAGIGKDLDGKVKTAKVDNAKTVTLETENMIKKGAITHG